jgi:MoaA/NifB/PqqE/SkfB family radical SAM enzyme
MNRYFPITRLEFAVTYLCNSKCRHCQLGEKEERNRFPNCIDKNKAVEITRKVGRAYHPRSIMTFGGEPLLYPEVVCAIHKEAARTGIPVREILTNGFWSRKTEKIQDIAAALVKSRVNEVSFSVDCFHQEFIPLGLIRKAAESLLSEGMPRVSWNPCWVISKHNDNMYNRKTKAILKKLEVLPVRCSDGNNVQPEGRATEWLKRYLPPKTRTPKGECGDAPYTEPLDSVHTVCVEPDAGIAVCKELHIGNASQTDIIDIIENYDPTKTPETKAIIEEGIDGLIRWASKNGVTPESEGYYNICHLCTSLRRRVHDHAA